MATPFRCGSVPINGLADELVVLAVRSDPKPMHPFFRGSTERTVVQANARAPQLPAAELLEVQRRVVEIGLEQRKIFAREQLHIGGQRVKALPEAL